MTRDRDPAAGPDRQRVDKWLWHARLVRTRAAAQALVTSGCVRVNREKIASQSRPLRVGDVVTVALGQSVRVLRIAAFAERRGSPILAQHLYADLAPPGAGEGPRIDRAGRPSKRDRSRLTALKRGGGLGNDGWPRSAS